MAARGARWEAKQAGSVTYSTGRPCKHGHIDLRYTSTGKCAECARIEARKLDPEKGRQKALAWYYANPDKAKALRKRCYDAKAEDRRAYARAYAKAHADEIRERARARRKANPLTHRVEEATRRALKKASGGSHTAADIQTLLKRQKSKCAHAWCRVDISGGFHTDHVLPLTKGGRNDRLNLQLLCQPCNQAKYNHHPVDHAQKHGFLL